MITDKVRPHPYVGSWTGRVCAAMVLRDGFGDECGLPAEHPVHQVTRSRGDRAVVTGEEAMAASSVLSQWREQAHVQPGQLSTSQLAQLRAYVMGALADAREGATLPGDRIPVERTLRVSLRTRDVMHLETARERLEARLRAEWARELQTSRLRPLGWPPVTYTWLRWPRDYAGGETGLIPCEEHQADELHVSIRGLAVPA